MKLFKDTELPSGNTIFTLVIEQSDCLHYSHNESSIRLISEYRDSPSIADKLLMLEHFARRVEEEKLKVTQAFAKKQRICGPQHESPPSSPGNRHSGFSAGVEGMRSSTEHAVSAANPRTGMTSRAGEACSSE